MVRTKVVWPRDDGNAVLAFKETAAMGRVDGSSLQVGLGCLPLCCERWLLKRGRWTIPCWKRVVVFLG